MARPGRSWLLAQVSYIGTKAVIRVSVKLTSANNQMPPALADKWLVYCIPGSNSMTVVTVSSRNTKMSSSLVDVGHLNVTLLTFSRTNDYLPLGQ